MTALEVYKLPFTCWGGSKILTSENNMALDFIARVNEESKQKIVNLLNGESTNYITDSVVAKEGEISINGTPILLVRGWGGHLTGTGLSEQESRIQKSST